MKMSYDSEVDAAYIRLEEGPFQVTPHEISEDVIINYAPDGRVVGIEILEASKYLFTNKKTPQVTLENIKAINQ